MIRMRKIITIIFLVLLQASLIFAKEGDWLTAKSTHFIVYYKKVSPDFINKIVENSERYYEKIAESLGFVRYNFWLWDNRAKIYIYDDAKQYQLITGQPSWSLGAATPQEKVINTFPNAKDFFDVILPHEMGHIIFREFVGFDNMAVPLWLEEGVASFQEKDRITLANKIVRDNIGKPKFMDLEALQNFNSRAATDMELINLFYAESVSIINYLIKEFEKDHFVFFCQNLKNKKSLERALTSSYPFNNLKELEEAWKKDLKN
jgi:hypothetical protein